MLTGAQWELVPGGRLVHIAWLGVPAMLSVARGLPAAVLALALAGCATAGDKAGGAVFLGKLHL
jgi:hypothetical protein